MKFERKLSKEGRKAIDLVQWKTLRLKLAPSDGDSTIVEVPAEWSDTAAQIIVTKYFRKAGVTPLTIQDKKDGDIPIWLRASSPGGGGTGPETSAKQLFHRLAGAWTYHGWKMGLFQDSFTKESGERGWQNDERSAKIFYDELYLILARQLAAPNSPQWFNTGLWWAYGIEGPASGQWAIDYTSIYSRENPSDTERAFETSNAYEYPQPHACFIQPVVDDLVNPGGIMDLWTREVRLFKQGSGTGSNFSTLRAKGEPLSGGGVSSGMMSFLDIGDRAAGAISSGGVTRRAAKMVVVDADHPEIEEFIDWKAREEQKAAAMWLGSVIAQNPDFCRSIPKWVFDRIGDHLPIEEFSIDYEGEAIRTVGGQNANNSVRVKDEFMNKLTEPQGALWYLKERTTGKLIKSMQATYLWNKILRAAWASADPGLQFHDTINRWHTCKADGEIRASNPCSEYMFLDDTACNLASLNLVRFYVLKNPADPTSHYFDIDLFCHVARLMTVALEISVSMASFPSREIALGSYNYRTLGLGYANLGGLLMRMGLPYDSNDGRRIAASTTALMTGIAYKTSEELAKELGPFPRWEANAESMTNVINMHFERVGQGGSSIEIAANKIWRSIDPTAGFRNAQVTLLAPTGTIGLLMDCDTLGIEPDFSLVKYKSLAGGGEMVLVNQAVEQVLVKLGYNGTKRNLITAYIKKHGTVEGCPDLQPEHLPVFDCATPPQGFSRSIAPTGHVLMMAAVQPFLSGAISKTVNMPNSATVEDVGEVYMAAWKLGLKAIAIYRDGSKLAQPLKTSEEGSKTKVTPTYMKVGPTFIEDLNRKYAESRQDTTPTSEKLALENYPKHGMTTEFQGRLVPRQKIEESELHELDFGAVGDMPKTFEDYAEQPSEPGVAEGQRAAYRNLSESTREMFAEAARAVVEDMGYRPANALARSVREYLPWRRESVYTQKVNLNDQSVHLTIGRYPDGRPGEIRIDLSRAGTTLDAMVNMAAMMISIGLQYGVPVEEYVKRLSGRKFEPSGLVEGHDNIKYASSIADLIARELGLSFLGRTEMGQVQGKSEEGEAEPEGTPIPIEYGQSRQTVHMRENHLDICPKCGEHSLTQNGSCHQCLNGECGFNDGCGG